MKIFKEKDWCKLNHSWPSRYCLESNRHSSDTICLNNSRIWTSSYYNKKDISVCKYCNKPLYVPGINRYDRRVPQVEIRKALKILYKECAIFIQEGFIVNIEDKDFKTEKEIENEGEQAKENHNEKIRKHLNFIGYFEDHITNDWTFNNKDKDIVDAYKETIPVEDKEEAELKKQLAELRKKLGC